MESLGVVSDWLKSDLLVPKAESRTGSFPSKTH